MLATWVISDDPFGPAEDIERLTETILTQGDNTTMGQVMLLAAFQGREEGREDLLTAGITGAERRDFFLIVLYPGALQKGLTDPHPIF